MSTTYRIALVAIVGIVLLVTILYVRTQRVKFYAQAIVIEELRDELAMQRNVADRQKEELEKCRMGSEAARIECEKQLMEVNKK